MTDPTINCATEDESSNAFDDYQKFTRTTAVYPGSGDGGYGAISYCTLGLVGESGEIAEKIKKRFRLGNVDAFEPGSVVDYKGTGVSFEEFREEMKKEIGDVLWYCAGLASELGFDLSDVAETNVAKLSSRKKRGVLKGKGDNR